MWCLRSGKTQVLQNIDVYGYAKWKDRAAILCYINGYTLDYKTGGACVNSIFRYLSDLYGEETVWNLMLFPNTVQDVTGKTWYTISEEWEQHIRDKYADVVLPEGYQPAK